MKIAALTILIALTIRIMFPKFILLASGWRLGCVQDARDAYGEGNYKFKFVKAFLFGSKLFGVYRKK